MVFEWCLTYSTAQKQCYISISLWWVYIAARLHRCIRSSAYWHCWIYYTFPNQLLHCTCTYIKCIPLPSLCLKAWWVAWVMEWGTHRLPHVTKLIHRTWQTLKGGEKVHARWIVLVVVACCHAVSFLKARWSFTCYGERWPGRLPDGCTNML